MGPTDAADATVPDESGGLRRVAAAVVLGDDPAGALNLAAFETAALFGAESGFVFRVDGPRVLVAGVWGREDAPVGAVFDIERDGVLPEVMATGRPARADRRDRPIGRHNSPVHHIACRYRGAIGAPVFVGEELWGVVVAATVTERPFPAGGEDRLAYFAEIAGIAIGNAEARAELARLAASDGLTGLLNHRAFHARLAEELELAVRHDLPVALALVDLDHFKAVNDTHGHAAGDAVLVELAGRVRALARRPDVVGRVGGEEFAWLLPQTGSAGALRAMTRLLRSIADQPFGMAGRVTVSIGVAELEPGDDARRLYERADEALYRAKEDGRNRIAVHGRSAVTGGPVPVPVPPAVEALGRALAEWDPAAAARSARVAALAERAAVAAGWPPGRAALLRDAALLGGMGALGPAVDRAGGADRVERIAGDALSAEQRGWLRDAAGPRGTPPGAAAGGAPGGGELIAAAGAWEAHAGVDAAGWRAFAARRRASLGAPALHALGRALGHVGGAGTGAGAVGR